MISPEDLLGSVEDVKEHWSDDVPKDKPPRSPTQSPRGWQPGQKFFKEQDLELHENP